MRRIELLDGPIEIEGRQVVLVEDRVGSIASMDGAAQRFSLLQPASDTADLILIEEEAILRARDKYPGLPVYGLWQTLIHSGVLSTQDRMQIIPENEGDGLYIRYESSIERFVESDRYVGQLFDAHPDVLIRDCHVIRINPSQLKLPSEEARTRKERADLRANMDRRFVVYGAIVAAAISALGFVVDFALSRAHQSAVIEYNARTAVRDERMAALDGLKTSRLASFPDYSRRIADLDAVLAIDLGFTLPDANQSSFSAPGLLVEINAPYLSDAEFASALPGARSVQYRPTGSRLVFFDYSGGTP